VSTLLLPAPSGRRVLKQALQHGGDEGNRDAWLREGDGGMPTKKDCGDANAATNRTAGASHHTKPRSRLLLVPGVRRSQVPSAAFEGPLVRGATSGGPGRRTPSGTGPSTFSISQK
jgi:hypothetical protein